MNDNKLIAEFMGIVYPKLDNVIVIDNVVIKEDELQYDKSWDWLMPVVIKCKESVDYCSDDNALDYHNIENEMLAQLSIEDTHKAVVKFIKTYNNG